MAVKVNIDSTVKTKKPIAPKNKVVSKTTPTKEIITKSHLFTRIIVALSSALGTLYVLSVPFLAIIVICLLPVFYIISRSSKLVNIIFRYISIFAFNVQDIFFTLFIKGLKFILNKDSLKNEATKENQ